MKTLVLFGFFLFTASATAQANCMRLSHAQDSRLGFSVAHVEDYSADAIVRLDDESTCRSVAVSVSGKGSVWLPFALSLASFSVADASTRITEGRVCRKFASDQAAWIRSVHETVRKTVTGPHEIAFAIRNANKSGRLAREILCTPELFGFKPH